MLEEVKPLTKEEITISRHAASMAFLGPWDLRWLATLDAKDAEITRLRQVEADAWRALGYEPDPARCDPGKTYLTMPSHSLAQEIAVRLQEARSIEDRIAAERDGAVAQWHDIAEAMREMRQEYERRLEALQESATEVAFEEAAE